MTRASCGPEVHPYLKAHPGDLLNLRPWRDLRGDIGECPGCHTSLLAPWSDERRLVEGVPSAALEAAMERDEAALEGRAA